MSDNTQPPAPPADETNNGGNSARASWPVSLDQLQANINNSSPEAQELLSWCFLWCINDAHPLPLPEFAAEVGVDRTTVWRIITGKYLDNATKERLPISDKLIRAMREFRRLATERAQETRSGVVETPTLKKIWQACDLARESRSPVFLIGPSHIGKTWALTEYTQRNNHGHTVYVRLAAASGLMGMVRSIAEALGISDRSATPQLVDRIKRALKSRPNTLLIFDEVHQLQHTYRKESFFACLEVLREIYDVSGVGMILCGTELLFTKVKNNRSDLEQLIRRGVHKVILPEMPTAGDVAAIAKALGLEMPEKRDTVTVRFSGETIAERPYDMLKQLGKEEGLKSITERFRYGSKLAHKANAPLAWEHVVRAHLMIRSASVNRNDWQ